MLRYALLGFLNYLPMSGYDIKRVMSRSTSNFWHARLSQIYATLKKLEEAGHIVSDVERRESRPDRRIYTITETGKDALREWLATPLTTFDQRKESLLLKVFFSGQTDKSTLLTQLRIQRTLHERQLHHYRDVTRNEIRMAVEESPTVRRDALLWEATLRAGEYFEETYIRWLDETCELVEREL